MLKREAAQARLSVHVSKYYIVGNHVTAHSYYNMPGIYEAH